MRSNIQPRSLALAVLVHLILVGFLWWGASWLQPQPTEVELWDAASLSAQAEQPVAVAVNETAPPVVKVEETVETADIETKVVKTVKPEPSDVKPVVEKKPVEIKPVPVKTLPSKPVTSSSNNSARDAVLGNAGKVPNATGTSQSGSNNAGYVAKVKSLIEARGRNQGLSGASGRVSFRVAPNGTTFDVAVSITPSDKKAILEGILRNLIVPRGMPDEALSRGIRFSVKF